MHRGVVSSAGAVFRVRRGCVSSAQGLVVRVYRGSVSNARAFI